jgi:DNA-binding PadR family transcriptional regulator
VVRQQIVLTGEAFGHRRSALLKDHWIPSPAGTLLLYRASIYWRYLSGAREAAIVTKRHAGRPPEAYLPLPPATFHILLALADGEQHGYAIMKGVAARSDGTVRLGPGTLYGALKRLLEAGLVKEGGERADPERGDERRRYYRLTQLGLSVARAEAGRLDALVRTARRKKLIGVRPA